MDRLKQSPDTDPRTFSTALSRLVLFGLGFAFFFRRLFFDPQQTLRFVAEEY